jgi:flagellar hook-associated protein 3 FlgL
MLKAQYDMAMAQREVSSGSKLNQASDDAASAAKVASIDDDKAAVGRYSRNVESGLSVADASDAALASVSDLLLEAKELAVAMGNGTYHAEDRALAATEIQSIRDQVLRMANTRHGDSYVFGGYLDETTPYDPTTGVYSGDSNRKQTEADEGYLVDHSLTGDEVFGAAGGSDVIGLLDDLIVGLNNNDTNAISQGVGDMITASDQIAHSRTKLGHLMVRMEDQLEILTDRNLGLAGDRQRFADADAIESLSEMAQAQQALSATLQVGARILNTISLVDYL